MGVEADFDLHDDASEEGEGESDDLDVCVIARGKDDLHQTRMQVFNARRRVGEEVVVGGDEACEPQTDGIEAFVVVVAGGLEVAARHNSCGDECADDRIQLGLLWGW